MSSPIENFIIEKKRESLIKLSFDYVGIEDSFNEVMALLIEKDKNQDKWTIKHKKSKIWTDTGWHQFLELDFFNETFNKYWNEIVSYGASYEKQDDTGNRKRIRKLPTGQTNGQSNNNIFHIMYYANQQDYELTGLEFYAVAAIVSTVNFRPVVQLGDLAISNIIKV